MLNERLSRQQGLFLMPSNPEENFIDNLLAVFKINELNFEDIEIEDLINLSKKEKLDSKIQIMKIEIPSKLHNDIVRYLREMNITSESLFPGLDGLAQSLVQTQIRN